jgi:hypothetical protein
LVEFNHQVAVVVVLAAAVVVPVAAVVVPVAAEPVAAAVIEHFERNRTA